MNHRAKHRKEVKKYLRKKATRETVGAAEKRDRKLFLFAEEPPLPHADTGAAGSSLEAHQGKASVALVHPSLKKATSSSNEFSEDRPGGTSTTEGMSENMVTCSDGAETTRDVSEGDFDFVFRTSELKDAKDATDAQDNAYGRGAHDEAVVLTDFYAEAASGSLAPFMSRQSVITETMGEHTHTPLGVCLTCIRIPDSISVLTSQHKITSTLHVKYLESVPAVPMTRPLPRGANLNAPTQNYMTVDCEYNLHQFSPGFQRDRAVAMRSIFASAVKEWHDHPPKDDTVIVSTAEAIRSIFQQAYLHDKPMGLCIRRVGPTLVVESRSSGPTDVDELRAQSLLGKALYRIREGTMTSATMPTTTTTTATTLQLGSEMTHDVGEVRGADETAHGVVALPAVRVGSAVIPPRLPSVNRFSQTLLWELDNLEVLVGVDTPIVEDSETCSRSMIKIEDESAEENPSERQRDLLDCWFDATLANVPQVDLYVHKDGVVQRHELKKVHELLGVVDGRIATAAMRFTSNVLQWLVRHCVRDGGTFGVVRCFDSEYLDLYELPESAAFTQPLADPTEEVFNDGPRSPLSSARATPHSTQERAERTKLSLNFARMCLAMGRAMLKQDGGHQRIEKIGCLLVRALVIFVKHASAPDVRQELGALVELLPELARQLVRPPPPPSGIVDPPDLRTSTARLGEETLPGMAGSGPVPFPMRVATTPDDLRAALITCCKFESRVRLAICRSDAAAAMATTPASAASANEETMALIPFLIPCSAALCVVVAHTLRLFSQERAGCTKLKRSLTDLAKQPGARRGEQRVQKESLYAQWRAACRAAKDYLQVAAEGLLRLENLAEVINRHCDESRSCDASEAQEDDGNTESAGECDAIGALTRLKKKFNACSLSRALAELYGDVVLLCMSDCTPFTVDVLHEIAKRLITRAESRHVPVSTTLLWLRELTPDRLSLSHTALRFYNKAGSNYKRHLGKVADVYYYVGRKHFYDSRYSKALEALKHSLALFGASDCAPCNEALGECFLGAGSVDARAVERALGDTYCRMAAQKARVQIQGLAQSLETYTTATRAATANTRTVPLPLLPHQTSSQPLAVGFARQLGKDEDNQGRRAIEAYRRAGANSDQARVLVHYVASKISAAAFIGVPLTGAASAELTALLDEAEHLDPDMLRTYREHQFMRLFTATQTGHVADTVVQKVKAIAVAWAAAPALEHTERADETISAAATRLMTEEEEETEEEEQTEEEEEKEELSGRKVSGCVCGPLVPSSLWCVTTVFRGTVLEDDRGLTVTEIHLPPIEKELQLALVSLVMACTALATERAREGEDGRPQPTKARSSKCWLHRCLRHVRTVLDLTEAACSMSASEEAPQKVAEAFTALRLRVAAVCWGTAVVPWWVMRMVCMVLVRLTPVVEALIACSPSAQVAVADVSASLDTVDVSALSPSPTVTCAATHLQLSAWVRTVQDALAQ